MKNYTATEKTAHDNHLMKLHKSCLEKKTKWTFAVDIEKAGNEHIVVRIFYRKLFYIAALAAVNFKEKTFLRVTGNIEKIRKLILLNGGDLDWNL